jgi:predicted O-methyltransferase YrrM
MRKLRYARFTRLIVSVFSLLTILAALLWWLVGSVSLIIVVPACALMALLLFLRLLQHGESLNERGRLEQLRQIQALNSLHALLPIQRPLPPLGEWAISPDFGELLISLIQQERPAHVLELGSGSSTIISSYALQRWGDGKITSLDHEAGFAELTRREIQRHGHSDRAQVIHAPLKHVSVGGEDHQWYDLECLPPDMAPIDLLIVDGPPRRTQSNARYPALPLLLSRLRPGAILLLDDGKRDEERAMVERWRKEVPRLQVDFRNLAKGAFVLRLPANPVN